ncbi:MAG: AIPR family protein [Bacteroidaceae bacterium]|nr:AIPR family protein [Bacteroidaceae bacterium]
MSEIINSQISVAKTCVQELCGTSITDDRAFSHVLLKNIYGVDYLDQIDLVTDGANDGGIDFLYYDEEENKVVVCQAKYTGALSFEQIITELNKMHSTVQNFKKAHTGSYNDKVKKALQNALDRLPDDCPDNVDFAVFTTAPLDINAAKKKIENSEHSFSTETVSLYSVEDIEKAIQRAQETLKTVSFEKIKLDRARNYLEYESDDLEGIFCNVLSTSIVQLYNKYSGAGLFDLNIRRYIRNKLVDSGITRTLDSDRENFWFLNNGIIIACTDFDVDGDTVRLENFSIVNGGQTTQLIGTYKGTNTKEFYIPCKIVATKDATKASHFYTKIAEATNSQKPIYPRDLKSNTPEMLRLGRWLEQEKVYLEIKRGYKPSKKFNYYIKNDELGQLILSFALQQPGTARNGKSKIFEASTYDRIFKVNYEKDPDKKGFVLDLIDLDSRYQEIEKKYKLGGLDPIQTEILKNGKQMIFAIMGICYRLANGEFSEAELLNSPKSAANIPFTYGKFISCYTNDDLEKRLERVIKSIVKILTDSYKMALSNKQVTSVSNYFKSDAKYYSDILQSFAQMLDFMVGDELKQNIVIFKRG